MPAGRRKLQKSHAVRARGEINDAGGRSAHMLSVHVNSYKNSNIEVELYLGLKLRLYSWSATFFNTVPVLYIFFHTFFF